MVYLEITLDIAPADRSAAASIYQLYKSPFLEQVAGASAKELLVRDEDVQVLHAFTSRSHAQAYLESDMFTRDVVTALRPLLKASPEIRIYTAH